MPKPTTDHTPHPSRERVPLVKPVGAVVAAVRILEHLAEQTAGVGVTQVARALDLNASTCFNILRTLAHYDMVVFDQPSKTYRVGLGTVRIAQGALSHGGLLGAVQPYLDRLAQEHQVTATLWRRSDAAHLVLVATSSGDAVVRIQMRLGQHVPLYIGAAGRAIAAHSRVGEATLRRAFRAMRWQSPPTFDEYLAGVEAARDRGWAIDDGHFMTGVLTVAAPVLAPDDTPTMVLATVMFSGQHTPERVAQIGAETRRLARLIEQAASTGSYD